MMEMSVNLKIDAALGSVHDAAVEGLKDGMDHVLNTSNEDVPLEYGDLQASGTSGVDDLTGYISYDTPYAVVQHEDLTLEHKNGRSAKYLENAMNSQKGVVLGIVAERIKGVL